MVGPEAWGFGHRDWFPNALGSMMVGLGTGGAGGGGMVHIRRHTGQTGPLMYEMADVLDAWVATGD